MAILKWVQAVAAQAVWFACKHLPRPILSVQLRSMVAIVVRVKAGVMNAIGLKASGATMAGKWHADLACFGFSTRDQAYYLWDTDISIFQNIIGASGLVASIA